MAFTTLIFMIMGRRITLKERLVIQEALNQSTLSGIVKLTRRILIGTFLVEGIGAFLLSFRFIPQYGAGKGIFFSIFHSVSAFCNAGILHGRFACKFCHHGADHSGGAGLCGVDGFAGDVSKPLAGTAFMEALFF